MNAQGFPTYLQKYDQDGNEISSTQRYKMCGNAVTVNVENSNERIIKIMSVNRHHVFQ